MLKRVLTSVVMVVVLIPLVIFSHTWVFPCAMAVLSAIATYEILKCLGVHHKWYAAMPAYAFSVTVVLLTRLEAEFVAVAAGCAMVYAVLLMCTAVFSRRSFSMQTATELFAMTLYATAGFASIVCLRDLPHGEYIFLLAMLGPWSCDIFAYFTGMLLGRHKLIPDVSPKKTVEGSVGGIVFGTGVLVLYGFLVSCFFDVEPRYLGLILMGLVLTVVSQCGDLIASLLKREHGIKDYGWLFPGHGGVMDRFDSVIISAIFLYIMGNIPTVFGIFF